MRSIGGRRGDHRCASVRRPLRHPDHVDAAGRVRRHPRGDRTHPRQGLLLRPRSPDHDQVHLVTPREVLLEYESAFQSAGYEPGYVLPSTLAALNGVEADRPTLLVKADGNFISVAIADKNEVIFYRMLDVVPGRTGTTIADEVYPSIVFFEDNYSAKIERILLSSASDMQELKRALEEQTGVRPETLDPGAYASESLSGEGLPSSALAGVAGVLTH